MTTRQIPGFTIHIGSTKPRQYPPPGVMAMTSSPSVPRLEPHLRFPSKRPTRKFNFVDYTPIKQLGSGSQGAIYRMHDNVTGKEVVIKRIMKKRDPSNPEKIANQWSIINEVEALSAVETICADQNQPQHALCWSHFGDAPKVFTIVMEYLDGYQNISELIAQREQWSDDLVFQMIDQMIQGLIQIHQVDVAHRDIKYDNIMIRLHPLNVKYIDFGYACYRTGCQDHRTCGTLTYSAPEITDTSHPPNSMQEWLAADIWSLGIVFLNLIAGLTDDRTFLDLMAHLDNPQKYVYRLATIDQYNNFVTHLKQTGWTSTHLNGYDQYCREHHVGSRLLAYAHQVVIPRMVNIDPSHRQLKT
uniref:Protein kinase domain-containing protein n=1 Tax=viral metagenome TaxID=1070528 RepID=A0A6C0BMB7_9ZZZZ